MMCTNLITVCRDFKCQPVIGDESRPAVNAQRFDGATLVRIDGRISGATWLAGRRLIFKYIAAEWISTSECSLMRGCRTGIHAAEHPPFTLKDVCPQVISKPAVHRVPPANPM